MLTYSGGNTISNFQNRGKVTVVGNASFASPVSIKAFNFRSAQLLGTFADVQLGDTFAVSAPAGEKFPTELKISVFPAGDLGRHKSSSELQLVDDGALVSLVFHTSCSQPLAIGDEFGPVFVAGYISDSGRQAQSCPSASDLPLCNVCASGRKLEELTLTYTGADESTSL